MKTGLMLGIHAQHASAVMPKRATAQSACWDVSACLMDGDRIQVYNAWNEYSTRIVSDQQFTLFGGERALIPTGWIFDIPVGCSMRLHPRSGLAWKQGISLANAEGVIDSDYTQETFVLLCNQTDKQNVISHGDRIAQFELVRDLEFSVTVLDQPPQQKTLRDGGFGSTGVQS